MQGGGGRDGTEGWKQDLSCPLLSFVFYPGCAHHLACPPPSKFLGPITGLLVGVFRGPLPDLRSHSPMHSLDPSCQSFASLLS